MYISLAVSVTVLYIRALLRILSREFMSINKNVVKGFTNKYNIHQLVWYEIHISAESAINREKQIKKWKRAWKLKLIEKENPEWIDLYESIC